MILNCSVSASPDPCLSCPHSHNKSVILLDANVTDSGDYIPAWLKMNTKMSVQTYYAYYNFTTIHMQRSKYYVDMWCKIFLSNCILISLANGI